MDKYNKKYLKLHNILTEKYNMKGGMDQDTIRIKFLIHALFDKHTTIKLNEVRDYIIIKYKNLLAKTKFIYDSAHITVIFGPVFEIDTKLYSLDNILIKDYKKDNDKIERYYPKFIDNFKGYNIDDVIYTGVSVFLSLNEVTIKASFESIKLNKIRIFLSKVDGISEHMDKFKKNYNMIKNKLKIKYPKLFIKDKSYNKNPSGWIHVTLAKIDNTIPEEKIIEIINTSETYMKKYGFIKDKTILKIEQIGVNYNKIFTKFW